MGPKHARQRRSIKKPRVRRSGASMAEPERVALRAGSNGPKLRKSVASGEGSTWAEDLTGQKGSRWARSEAGRGKPDRPMPEGGVEEPRCAELFKSMANPGLRGSRTSKRTPSCPELRRAAGKPGLTCSGIGSETSEQACPQGGIVKPKRRGDRVDEKLPRFSKSNTDRGSSRQTELRTKTAGSGSTQSKASDNTSRQTKLMADDKGSAWPSDCDDDGKPGFR